MSWSRSSAIQNATCTPHTTGFRVARARATSANGQPIRGRHAPRCAPADAGSAGRGRGLGALPRSAYTHAAAASRLWGAISYEPAVACRHPAVQSWRQQPAKSFEQLCGPVAALEHPQLRQTSKQRRAHSLFRDIIANHENKGTSRHKPHGNMNSYTVL